MNQSDSSTMQTTTLEYGAANTGTDGSLAELPGKLNGVVPFDSVSLTGLPTSKRLTLWLRCGAKRIFHIRIIRKSGRSIIELGGLEPAQVCRGILICKDHFDNWFGVTPDDVKNFEDCRK